MKFWLLTSVGILNIYTWYLIIKHNHLITRSNENPWTIFAGISNIISIGIFIIGFIKLGINSWETTITINHYGYTSAILAAISTSLLLRPFVYEIIHRHEPSANKPTNYYNTPRIKSKRMGKIIIFPKSRLKKGAKDG